MENFESYTKISEEVFDFGNNLIMKITVAFNTTTLRKGNTKFSPLHNEYTIVNSGNKITTNLRYKYYMSLTQRGNSNVSIDLTWENYDEFCELIDTILEVCDVNAEGSPFDYVRGKDGVSYDLRCNSNTVRPMLMKDYRGASLYCVPVVIDNKKTGSFYAGVSFVFNESSEDSFNVTINRIKGFKRFLSTYNPLLHASTMAKYMGTTGLLGTNNISL